MDDKPAHTPDEIVREARERLRLASDAESSNRTDALTALEFRNGFQWPKEITADRVASNRPSLTINITDAVVRRIENNCRENRPRIKIDPVGDGADIDTAKVLNGLTRHVEAISGADYAYDCAQSAAITAGWGWLSVANDFADDTSMDQELFIVAHRNPFKVYPDPSSKMPDGSDLNWLLESEMMDRADYKDQYGHLDPGGWQFIGYGDSESNWSNKEQIRVAKYWRVERVKDELHKFADGTTAFKSEKANKGPPIGRREVLRRQVKCYLMSAHRILKEWDWPGRYIPYVPVYGRELDINGKVTRKGVVKDLMDPARMYNYTETAKTELYALQPKAPWLMPGGSMEGHESGWRDANIKPVVALEYKQQYGADGVTPLPPPMRQPPPPMAAGFQEWSQSSQSNFMAVAGMPHDPNQDAKGEVVSGVALKKRQGMSDISHYDFYDNFTRSLRQVGRILVDLYPHFYSAERMQRIVREDGTSEMVGINQKKMENGVMTVKNNLQVGRYDVVIDTGPGYQTKREETAEALLELVTGTGKLGEMISVSAADKVMRQFDFADADGIADRLMALIPAAQAEKQMGNLSQDQLKAMVAGLQQQLQQSNQKSMALELELQSKTGLEKLKQDHEDARHAKTLQVKREDVLTKAHTSMVDTHTKAQASIAVAEIGATGGLLGKHVDNAHEKELAEKQLESADNMADKQIQSSEKIAASKPAPKAK